MSLLFGWTSGLLLGCCLFWFAVDWLGCLRALWCYNTGLGWVLLFGQMVLDGLLAWCLGCLRFGFSGAARV